MIRDRLVLGLDTSTRKLGLALVARDGTVLAAREERAATHATLLVPSVETLLTERGAEKRDLVAIGVVTGPGSFTGLRIGLASALGFSRALAVPAYGIQSLEALALAEPVEGEGLALLDARRSQVYCQRFFRSGMRARPLSAPEALEVRAVLGDGAAPGWAVGDGVPLVPGWPDECRLFPEIPNLAVQAALRALEALHAGLAPTGLAPTYIRPPDVRPPATFDRIMEGG